MVRLPACLANLLAFSACTSAPHPSPCRWSAVSRTERYRKRLQENGEDVSALGERTGCVRWLLIDCLELLGRQRGVVAAGRQGMPGSAFLWC